MKRLISIRFGFLVILFLLSKNLYGQSGARVVFLEHSLRWSSENRFPYFFKLPDVKDEIFNGIQNSIGRHLNVSEVRLPNDVNYRLIDGFGKAKLSFPKSFTKDAQYYVALSSAISREVTGFGMLWSMEIEIRDANKTVYKKKAEHELEPGSVSLYSSNQRWIDPDEFISLFLSLLDETLDLGEPLQKKIIVGSPERIRDRISRLMPVENQYTLAVAGAMMNASNATFQLRKDSVVLENYFYREGWTPSFTLPGLNQIFAEIFTSITGFNLIYQLTSKESRFGRIETSQYEKRKLRLDWLTESEQSRDRVYSGPVIASPIAGQFYDKDSLYAHFFYYRSLVADDDSATQTRSFYFRPKGTLGQSIVHQIRGKIKTTPFELYYPEQEAVVLISIDDKPAAALSLFNVNPASRSFSGSKLSENKKVMTTSAQSFKKPDATKKDAEWYPFYTSSSVSDETTADFVTLLICLFFAIGQTGESTD